MAGFSTLTSKAVSAASEATSGMSPRLDSGVNE